MKRTLLKHGLHRIALFVAIAALFALRTIERGLAALWETLDVGLSAGLGFAGVVGVTGPDNPEQVGSDQSDGMKVGKTAGSLVGYWGANPTTQPTNPSQSAMSYALGQSAIVVYSSAQTFAAVNGATAAEQSATVTGIVGTTSLVFVNKPTTQTGLGIGSTRASAANTIQVTFYNVTAATNITPTGGEAYLVIEIRGPVVQTMTMAAAGGTAGNLSPQPTAVAANTTSIQTYTLTPNTGLQGLSHSKLAQLSVARSSAAVNMPSGTPQTVIVNKPTAQSGLALAGARISGNNLLELTWINVTAAPITPTASEAYLVAAFRGISLKVPIVEFDVNVGTLAAVNNVTAPEQTVASVTGLAVGDQVLSVGKPTDQAGIGLCASRLIGTTGTLTLKWVNPTAGAVTPTGSEVYRCPVWKTGLGSAGGANGGGRQIAQQFSATLAVAAQAANLGAEQTFASITGLISGAPIMVNLQSQLPVGLGIANIRVSAAGTLAIAFANATGATIAAFNVTVNILQFAVQGSVVLTGTGNGVTFPFDETHHQLAELLNALQGAEVGTGGMLGS